MISCHRPVRGRASPASLAGRDAPARTSSERRTGYAYADSARVGLESREVEARDDSFGRDLLLNALGAMDDDDGPVGRSANRDFVLSRFAMLNRLVLLRGGRESTGVELDAVSGAGEPMERGVLEGTIRTGAS